MVTKSVTNGAKMASDTTDTAPGSGADDLFSVVDVPYIGDLDRRTRAARLFKAALTALISDRGGAEAMSSGELLLARRAAGAGVLCDSIEGRIVAGEDIRADLVNSYLAASNSFRRLVITLGLKRAPKDITTLAEYMKAKAEVAP